MISLKKTHDSEEHGGLLRCPHDDCGRYALTIGSLRQHWAAVHGDPEDFPGAKRASSRIVGWGE